MYTAGCYCALVILYFIPFLSVFYFYILSILAPPGVCILLLVPLSKSGSPRRKRRHSVPLFAKRAVSWNGETPADSRTKNHNRRSRGEIHGGLLTSREGDLRVSMQIPVVAPWRGGGGGGCGGGGKKVGAADTNKMRRGRSKRRRRY